MTVLTLYSRPGCHLCDEMKAVVGRVVRSAPALVTFSEVDISGEPELERQYGLEVPVLTLDGRKVAKFRIEERQLRRMIGDLGPKAESPEP